MVVWLDMVLPPVLKVMQSWNSGMECGRERRLSARLKLKNKGRGWGAGGETKFWGNTRVEKGRAGDVHGEERTKPRGSEGEMENAALYYPYLMGSMPCASEKRG